MDMRYSIISTKAMSSAQTPVNEENQRFSEFALRLWYKIAGNVR